MIPSVTVTTRRIDTREPVGVVVRENSRTRVILDDRLSTPAAAGFLLRLLTEDELDRLDHVCVATPCSHANRPAAFTDVQIRPFDLLTSSPEDVDVPA